MKVTGVSDHLGDGERVSSKYKSGESTDGGKHWHEWIERQTHCL